MNMDIKIDTSAITEAKRKITDAANAGKKLACLSQLSSLKIKTIPVCGRHPELSAEDKAMAADLIAKMQVNGWLTETDLQWCKEVGISVT